MIRKIKLCKTGQICMYAWAYGITGTKNNWVKDCKDVKDCGNMILLKTKGKLK